MNTQKSQPPTPHGLPIAAVERETGVPRDLLRMWERRYGFPAPLRDAHGDRVYPPEQVERLRQIRRLLDLGLRPGRVVALGTAELDALLADTLPAPRVREDDETELLPVLAAHDTPALRALLRRRLAELGLARFAGDYLPHTGYQVGDAWARGVLGVRHEHLYSEHVSRVLREAMALLPEGGAPPRVMLTTAPGEAHALGLMLAETQLRLAGCQIVPFGVSMPFAEMAAACAEHRIDVLCLSFSAAYTGDPGRELPALIAALPGNCELWVGGAGSRPTLAEPRVHTGLTLAALPALIGRWRAMHG
ncbi:MerR family transcriptional regulator [Crenobacter intestini]|uniref:MerR family transcriptional regulator n=1 Tax=Crenobacter intestini TaxID=2563443 RepID=A0A4T0V609_9NEIS|nr:MerR family transcriptional regulator [Crenobacter intestini]TIC87204.1 MerR family transcriptional regulator [Crenobacter intestini]